MKQFTNALKQKSFKSHKYPCLNASNFDHFETFIGIWVSKNHQHTSFKSLGAALFKRETLLSSLSEPAAHKSMKEQLLRKFSEKCL